MSIMVNSINSNTGDYYMEFELYGVPIYAEYECSENMLYTTLIEIGGVDMKPHLKDSYVQEIEREIENRMKVE